VQGKRTKFKADFKAKVALEALKGDKSTAELAQIYGVHPTQVTQWKKQLLDQASSVFEGRQTKVASVDVDELYKKIGKLEMERDFFSLAARSEWSSGQRRQLIDPGHALPVSDQCRLLGVARSTYYYERANTETPENLALMQEIDQLYLAHPENGSRMMTSVLRRRGREINRKRVQRLMRLMGIRSLCPQPKTTTPNKAHPVYPYLLRDLPVTRPNQVWAADITYIPSKKDSGTWSRSWTGTREKCCPGASPTP